MKIGWQASSNGPERVYLAGQLTVPARYNFTQGFIYRLKLTDIPGRPGAQLYPTIEVAPSTPATDAYLSHNPIPVQFTAEDFDQVIDGGNFVTKVIYLPDPKYQELAIAGVETLVSTRLEPGRGSDPRSRQAWHDPADRSTWCDRSGDAVGWCSAALARADRRCSAAWYGSAAGCPASGHGRACSAAGDDRPPGNGSGHPGSAGDGRPAHTFADDAAGYSQNAAGARRAAWSGAAWLIRIPGRKPQPQLVLLTINPADSRIRSRAAGFTPKYSRFRIVFSKIMCAPLSSRILHA